jgi:hypothetical protein
VARSGLRDFLSGAFEPATIAECGRPADHPNAVSVADDSRFNFWYDGGAATLTF